MLLDIKHKDYTGNVIITKEDDGRYKIVSISTVALKDRDGETFSIPAMDYDIKLAEKTGQYPEYRVFHDKRLGIGQVEKMYRVGMFMVDEGHSYTDSFSKHVVEKMLLDNPDGKWRVSRGFEVFQLQGRCPICQKHLVLNKEHFKFGFRCPACERVHLKHKGVLSDITFQQVRTFDVTVTDVPAVPMTSVQAFPLLEVYMNKMQLKQRLLDAGLDEKEVDQRLATVDESALKEYDDIPDAVLKELGIEEIEKESDDDQPVFVDQALVDAIGTVVKEAVAAALADVEIELEAGNLYKESSDAVAELRQEVQELKELLTNYLKGDTVAVKELLADQPKSTKKRVMRFKSDDHVYKAKPPVDDEDEDDEDDDYEDDEMDEKKATLAQAKKEAQQWIGSVQVTKLKQRPKGDALIADGSGQTYGSLSDLLNS